jgi:hypothetical protein
MSVLQAVGRSFTYSLRVVSAARKAFHILGDGKEY